MNEPLFSGKSGMLVNSRAVRIEWGDCDAAGIVYYPRYFAIFDACTSGADRARARHDQARLSQGYDFAGHPLVRTRSRFVIPTRFGDDVTIESAIAELRRSSFDVHHRLLKQGRSRSKASRRACG